MGVAPLRPPTLVSIALPLTYGLAEGSREMVDWPLLSAESNLLCKERDELSIVLGGSR